MVGYVQHQKSALAIGLLQYKSKTWVGRVALAVSRNSRSGIYIFFYIVLKYDISCEVEDFVETHIFKLRVILRSRVPGTTG